HRRRPLSVSRIPAPQGERPPSFVVDRRVQRMDGGAVRSPESRRAAADRSSRSLWGRPPGERLQRTDQGLRGDTFGDVARIVRALCRGARAGRGYGSGRRHGERARGGAVRRSSRPRQGAARGGVVAERRRQSPGRGNRNLTKYRIQIGQRVMKFVGLWDGWTVGLLAVSVVGFLSDRPTVRPSVALTIGRLHYDGG